MKRDRLPNRVKTVYVYCTICSTAFEVDHIRRSLKRFGVWQSCHEVNGFQVYTTRKNDPNMEYGYMKLLPYKDLLIRAIAIACKRNQYDRIRLLNSFKENVAIHERLSHNLLKTGR